MKGAGVWTSGGVERIAAEAHLPMRHDLDEALLTLRHIAHHGAAFTLAEQVKEGIIRLLSPLLSHLCDAETLVVRVRGQRGW